MTREELFNLLQERPYLEAVLMKAANKGPRVQSTVIDTPTVAADVLRMHLEGAPEERFVCMALDQRLRLLAIKEIGRGCRSNFVYSPAGLWRWVLLQGKAATYVIVGQ